VNELNITKKVFANKSALPWCSYI